MRSFHFLHCSVVILLSTSAGHAQAAEAKLRWKFEAGEQLLYEVGQKMTMEMKFGETTVKTVVDQTLEMVNITQSVNEEGAATIEQSIRRMVMTMQLPDGREVKIDSADQEEPEDEFAKSMLPLIKRLTKAKFTFQMQPSGQISDLTVPDDLFDKDDKSPVAQMFAKMFTKDSLKQIVTQGSPVFPKQELKVGEKWQQRYSFANPVGLEQTVDNTFTYFGPGEGDEASLEKLGIELLVEFAEPAEGQPQIEISNQDSRGTIYFDAAAGRMAKSSLDQSLEMKIKVGGIEMDQKIRNQMNVKVTPVKSDR